MKNMMKEYLKNDYSDNHLRNFCLYWTKAAGGSGDEWRRGNDLDCLYFGGDLRADTLMSAWTPIKWVADLLNEEKGIRFCKRRRDSDDPCRDLRILAEDGEKYLPQDHSLVKLLNIFLQLAEHRCNFILLPDRRMNRARYKSYINGEKVWLCDEVPATLSHVFDKNSLGRFFATDTGEVDRDRVTDADEVDRDRVTDADEVDRDHVTDMGEVDRDHVTDTGEVDRDHVTDTGEVNRDHVTDTDEVDRDLVTAWIRREHLEMGFEGNKIAPENVRPLIRGLDPHKAKWLRDAGEIEEALIYMIDFLEKRTDALKK